MNHSLLPRYDSLSQITPYLQDFFYVMIIPSIVVFGFFIKIITIDTLRMILNKKNPFFIFYYMLAFEVVDYIAGIILAFLALFECGHFCQLSYKYITKLFELIFFTYFTNVALQFQSFLEISLAFDRIRSFSVKNNNEKISIKKLKIKILILFVLAFIVAIPNYILSRPIKPIGILIKSNKTQEILYLMSDSELSDKNDAFTLFLFVYDLFRGLFLHILLIILNFIVILKYKAYLNNKKSTHFNVPMPIKTESREATNRNYSNQTKEIKLTKMVFAMNCNFIIGNLPISIVPIFFRITGESVAYNFYTISVDLIALFTHLSYLIFYLKYNPIFRKAFLERYAFFKNIFKTN